MSDTEPQATPEVPDVPDVPAEAGDAGAGQPEEGTKPKKARRGHLPRRISAWVLVVLASLLIPVSVISVWAIRTVTNTDQYVATMAPLARNQVIVDHLAQRATDALFGTVVILQRIR